ncbi:PepSY domain-containing protein [Paenibacillus nicotianae]|uniref:PepSY domain-containing protein n=1 Tax=Paenibacillus nicotianae TaxID=1526551 RepID=A0ABW4UYA3_9BACL
MKRYNRTKEELKKILDEVDRNFPRHHRRINEITMDTVLTPEEAIAIAKKYHEENKEEGIVSEEIERLYFDEGYTFKRDENNRENDDIRPAWRVTVDLPPNPFLFEDYTLIVSDRDRKVMGMLGQNGQPVEL